MSKRLIIYAEDDADDRFVFEHVFEDHQHKFDIRFFKDGLELMNFLSEHSHHTPSLIVLDINMPRLNGKETLRHLRAEPKFRNTPVVFLTTSSSQQDIDFGKRFNAALITKPMNQSSMKDVAKMLISLAEEKSLRQ